MCSRNTRYGVDHGLMFRTLTTSRGINSIISPSASYFDALANRGDRDQSQELIRPKFLQMLVLLLSLLNDEDLGELKEFLETTYRIKADRQISELLVLTVLPLMSINSQSIHESPSHSYRWGPCRDEARHEARRQIMEHFRPAVSASGLYASWDSHSARSKWSFLGHQMAGRRHQGLSCLPNLQHDDRSRTMNEIPSPDLNLDSTLDEVTVVLRTGIRYILGHDDLEKIICMAPDKYSLADTVARGQIHDLEIGDVVVNSTLCEAIFRLNSIIAEYNSSLPAPRRHSFVLTRLSFLREKPPITPFKEIKGSGRLTWHRARLGDQTLAVA
jgi:hypothetical protein